LTTNMLGGVPLNQDARQITTTISSGGPNLSLGITYAHLFWENSPQFQGLDTIHVGLNLRPSRYWALGAVIRDLLAPPRRVPTEQFQRSYDFELAVRPLGTPFFEVAGGGLIGEDPGNPVNWHGRGLLRLLPGLTLYGQFDSVEFPTDFAIADRLARDSRALF